MDPNQPDAVDPVCGMRVARGVALHLKLRGITYWFCGPACADTFRNVGAARRLEPTPGSGRHVPEESRPVPGVGSFSVVG